MSAITRSQYASLIVGLPSSPVFGTLTMDQRVSLKSIVDAKGSTEQVRQILRLPSLAPVVASAASAAVPVDMDSANKSTSAAAENAKSAAPEPAGDSDGGSASQAEPSVSGLTNPLSLEVAQVHDAPANESESQIAVAADNAESASSGSSAFLAAPATGSAVSNEPQGKLAAPSQSPAPDVNGSSASRSAPPDVVVTRSLTSAAAPSISSARRSATVALDSSIGGAQKRHKRDVELDRSYVSRRSGAARQNHQVDLGQGLPNPIFDQEKDCFKNSIALLMRLQHVPTSLNLQSPNMSLCDINVVLNQGGYYLRQLPLYFDENQKKFFKPEVPTLLAVFLKIQFGVDLPWLHDSSLDFSQVQRSISRVLLKTNKHNVLPFLILNPFNNNGVPLHCVGLDCRWNKATVWDPANVNSFEFSLRTLNALCDGRWTLSFRRIWCICARA